MPLQIDGRSREAVDALRISQTSAKRRRIGGVQSLQGFGSGGGDDYDDDD